MSFKGDLGQHYELDLIESFELGIFVKVSHGPVLSRV